MRAGMPESSTLQRLLRQYLYFCTSKARKVSVPVEQDDAGGGGGVDAVDGERAH
jgi:hypothetical protein